MNEAIETVKNMVEMGLFNQPRKTEDELRKMIRGVYNSRRPHSSLDGKTPDQAYFNRPMPEAVAA